MRRRGRREWATVVWVLGVALLWRSRAWSTRDKLIGTLVVPGGLACIIYAVVDAALLVYGACEPEGCSVGVDVDPLSAVVLVAMTVLPLATAIYLAIRADATRPS